MITIIDCLCDDNPNYSLTLLGGVLGSFTGVAVLVVPFEVQLLIEFISDPPKRMVEDHYHALLPSNLSLSLQERTA